MVHCVGKPLWVGDHINVLELRTVHLALKALLPSIHSWHVLIRTDSPVLGLSASGVSQGNLYSKSCELGSKRPVQHWSYNGRVEAPSRRCSSLMDLVQQGSDWPICIGRDDPLQDVVLPQGSGRSPGFGCAVTRVARRIVVHFSSVPFDYPGTQEDHPGPFPDLSFIKQSKLVLSTNKWVTCVVCKWGMFAAKFHIFT